MDPNLFIHLQSKEWKYGTESVSQDTVGGQGCGNLGFDIIQGAEGTMD
jgi:hypothetical protein